MDAERYQRIQDLFWEAIELDETDREGFLARLLDDPNDQELIDEVRSLLAEHDHDAAIHEGENARTVVLPEGLGGALASESAGANLRDAASKIDTTKNPASSRASSGDGQVTVGGFGRTHAAPREGPQRRSIPIAHRKLNGSSVLTSIGPAQSRWALLPIWLLIVLGLSVPAWISTWWWAKREAATERIATVSKLQLVLDNAHLKIDALLAADRLTAEDLAGDLQEREFLEQDLGSAERDSVCWIWDTRFRLIAASPATGEPELWKHLIGKRVAPLGAASVAQALAGQPTFFPPGLVSPLVNAEPTSGESLTCGWFLPLRQQTADADQPSAALLVGFNDTLQSIESILAQLFQQQGCDLYLVDREGYMRSNSRLAQRLTGRYPADESGSPLVGNLRVSEPRSQSSVSDSLDAPGPLTVPAAAITLANQPQTASEPYRSYHGRECLGSWVWMPQYELGLIAEQATEHFASPFRLAWPWAVGYSLLSMLVASGVSFWHGRKLASMVNSRQPLGRYKIVRELGSGGMGVVYQAKHLELGKDIALKVLRSDRQDDDDRQRFDREARVAATLSSPHSVTVYDYGYSEEGNAFCVMELLDGLTLAEIVARDGPQPVGRVVWIMQQICQAVIEAHSKGLLHRDLKPQNVMLRLDSVVGDWATVFDFGLAKQIIPEKDMFQTAETIWAGTPMYMAPERFRDPTSMDPRSDVYSMGCIAYFLLAGKPPFAECDPESMFALIMSQKPLELATHLGHSIDEHLDACVRSCMVKDKNSRLGSAEILAEQLLEISVMHDWSRHDAQTWWQTFAAEMLTPKSKRDATA